MSAWFTWEAAYLGEGSATKTEEKPDKYVWLHGHCWLCEEALWLHVLRPGEDDTFSFECKVCQVREKQAPCSCDVERVEAA